MEWLRSLYRSKMDDMGVAPLTLKQINPSIAWVEKILYKQRFGDPSHIQPLATRVLIFTQLGANLIEPWVYWVLSRNCGAKDGEKIAGLCAKLLNGLHYTGDVTVSKVSHRFVRSLFCLPRR